MAENHIGGVVDGISDADDSDDQSEELEYTELPDGSYDVAPVEREEEESDFYENLAEKIPSDELTLIVTDLLEKIEYDKESRRERDEQYAEGLRRTGMGDDAPGGASFSGASKVVHPMLAEAAVDFSASAMRELFPPDGPTRTFIPGDTTQEKLEIADRQQKGLNLILTEEMPEYPEELEQLLTQLPLGGSQFQKFWINQADRRIESEFIPIDDILIPYACSEFWSAHRITHVQRLSASVWEDRIDSGMYVDVDSQPGSDENPEQTKASEANERIEGKAPNMMNIDGVRLVYEVNTNLKISLDGKKRRPYLISICEQTRKVAAVYRNWDEEDQTFQRLHWIVDYGFIQWRGAFKVGLIHLIGGLAAAATGALRALMDGGLISTLPMLVKLKGTKFSGESKTIDPTQAVEIDGNGIIDDVRKAFAQLPYAGPSPVLFQLMGWLTDTAKGVVSTAEEKIKDASNQMPVGTALALIEQGAKVFSSIHARLHRSQRKALKILSRLIPKVYDEETQMERFGQVIFSPDDFKKPLLVLPVSDPNIFSEGQRYAQMHLVQAFAEKYPQMHDMYEVLHTSYKLAKIPDIDRLLPKPKGPQELNAVSENSAAVLGQPLMAFPEQDHESHIEVHMRFAMDPILGGNAAVVPSAWPRLLEHVKQHIAFLYAKVMHDIVSQSLGTDVGEAMRDKQNWPKIDRLMAAASSMAHDELSKRLQFIAPEIDKIMRQVMLMRPPTPMDPSTAAMKIAETEAQRLERESREKLILENKKLEEKRDKDMADVLVNAAKVHADVQMDGDNAEMTNMQTELDRQHEFNMSTMQSSEQEAQRQHEMEMATRGQAHDMNQQVMQSQQDMASQAVAAANAPPQRVEGGDQ